MKLIRVFIILIINFFTLIYSQCDSESWEDYFPNLDGCSLSGADLYGQDFSYASLDDADLSVANLATCDFTGASLENANLSNANTWNANFTDALMCGVDLSSLTNYIGNPILDVDCFDVCGGSGELDECGVCDGDGTACFGCMDPFATNYSELAIYDDGSCEYFDGESDGEAPPMIWEHRLYNNTSFPSATNGLNNLQLNYSTHAESQRNNNCVAALDNSVICKANLNSYNHGIFNANWGNGEENGSREIIIYKLNSDGDLVWYTEHGQWIDDYSWTSNGTYMYDHTNGSIIEQNGDYYITGYSDYGYGQGSYIYTYFGFILKINEQGEQVWIRTFDLDLSEYRIYQMFDIAASDSAICAVGYSYNDEINNDDGMIHCCDSDGNQLLSQYQGFLQQYSNPGNTNNDYLYSVTALSDGDFIAFGKTNYDSEGGSSFELPWIVKFNENGVIFHKIINEIELNNSQLEQSDLIEMSNGNILIAAASSSGYGLLIVINEEGEFISSAVDHLNFELGGTGTSRFYSLAMTNDNQILLSGYIANSFNSSDMIIAKLNTELNFEWVDFYGSMFNGTDYGQDILQLPNNKIIVTGFSMNNFQNNYTPTVLSYEYASGCMAPSACNYNPIATFDNGSCYFEDACDVCDGNGYDFCDDDGDGTNNLDQWGYGAYNILVEDVPGDQGGNLFISFNKSFYDTDELQGDRAEMYTIEILDNEQWYTVQSLGAYGADSYNALVPTLRNNEEFTFRVIANMDEGNFLSFETVTGISIDNLAPDTPEMFSGSFDGEQVNLSWNSSSEPDLLGYSIYRDGEHYGDAITNSFIDTQLPNLPMLSYTITANDVNGNESSQTEELSLLIYIDGDINTDFTLNVLDVVLLMEHILNFSPLEDTTYADLNDDAIVNVLDVIILVNLILDMNGGE